MSATPLTLKLNKRVRRLIYRIGSPYSIFASSIVLSYTALKVATASGSNDTHRSRVSAGGTYKKAHYAEENDNPLYRLAPNANGGHRLDGGNQQQARRAALQHH